MYYRLLHLISLSPCRHVGHLLSLCPRHFSPFDLVGDGRPASKEEEVPSTRGKLLTLLLLLFHWEMDDNFSYFCLVPYTLSIRPVRRRRRRGSSPSFYRQSASRGIDLCPTIYYTEREREKCPCLLLLERLAPFHRPSLHQPTDPIYYFGVDVIFLPSPFRVKTLPSINI